MRHSLVWSRSLTNKNVASSTARSAFPAFQQQFRFKSSTTPEPPVTPAATLGSKDEEEKPAPKKRTKPYLLNLGVPSLVPEWKKMFDPSTVMTDISAGIAVGCIAVPLSLAIAMASGVPAEVGLATAAVSGIAGSLMGGTTLAITGPAAAISLLVLGAVNTHGLMALPFITVTVGGLQVASGVTRMGVYAKLVPVSVIAGFTTGVGALILCGQIPKALGMVAPEGMNPIEMVAWLGPNIGSMSPSSAALAFGTAAALYALPKIHPKMPAAVIAVGGATAATTMLGLDVTLIGTLPSGMDAFQMVMPQLPPMDHVGALVSTTLLIYLLTTVESLLSCVALDKMQKTDYKHNSDQELIVSTVCISLVFLCSFLTLTLYPLSYIRDKEWPTSELVYSWVCPSLPSLRVLV
jgi:MFS superfamily sulfate permease-like transporter